MKKNSYVIQTEKELAELRRQLRNYEETLRNYEEKIPELRKKVRIDSAYIGAGHVLALHELGFKDEDIETIMQMTNEKWNEIYDLGVNPLKYCEEKTGYELITDEQQKELINSYFEGDEQSV